VSNRRADMSLRLKTVTFRHGGSEAARADAAMALADEGEAGAEALLDGLGDRDVRVRALAGEALAQVNWREVDDSLWAEASALLVSALNDRDPGVRGGAARALGRVGGEAAVDALQAMAADPVESVRLAVSAALGRLAPNKELEWAFEPSYGQISDGQISDGQISDGPVPAPEPAGSYGPVIRGASAGRDAQAAARDTGSASDEPRRMIECPGCRRMAKPEAVRCQRCGSRLRP